MFGQLIQFAVARAVVARRQVQSPLLVQFDLVAQVQAGRRHGGIGQAAGGRTDDGRVVDRVEHIERDDAAYLVAVVHAVVIEVQARHHIVFHAAKGKRARGIGVQGAVVAIDILQLGRAALQQLVGGQGGHRHEAAIHGHALPAEVLRHFPAVPEPVHQAVADLLLRGVIRAETGFAVELIALERAIAVRQQRAFHGRALGAQVLAAGVGAEDGEIGAWRPGPATARAPGNGS